MPSDISLTGASETERTSFYHFDGSQFTDGLSLSELQKYETCYKSVDPQQRFVAVGYYGHFTFGYDPIRDRLQFVSISEAYAKDGGRKVSDDTVVLGHLDLDEDEEQLTECLLNIHYERLGKLDSGEASSREDQEAALKENYLGLARQLKQARRLQLEEKAAEEKNSQCQDMAS